MTLLSLHIALGSVYRGRPRPGPVIFFSVENPPPPLLLIRVLLGILVVLDVVNLVIVSAAKEFRRALVVDTVISAKRQ